MNGRRWLASGVAWTGILLAVAAGAAPAAAQGGESPVQPPARVLFWGTGGVSMRSDPMRTHLADVWTGSARLGVPIGRFVPFVNGAYARAKTGCALGTTNCSNTETRLLGGLAYVPNGGGPGPYAGLGLGVRDYRGTQDLGHSFFIGLTFPWTHYVAPTVELRSEGYRSLNELLIIAAGVRFALPRPLPAAPAPGS